MAENVYKSPKLIYDSLEIEDAKSLFLLCGLMGYGDISLDDLFKYSLGLGLFQSIKTLDESTNRLHALVDSLKASSLLLDIDKEYVKMDDVVRDVARQLVSEDPRWFVLIEATQSGIHESTRYIPLSLSHEGTLDLGERLDRPKIEFFLLHNEGPLKIPDPLFNGMGKLKVVHLFQMEFSSLPLSLQSLTNLRTLCLDCCTLGDVAQIGELKKLEVLSFRGSKIVQLPREIAQLTCLRWLDLSNCRQLREIPPNILSNLSQLEHLSMKPPSFTLWNQESNACLAELKHLSLLTTLNIALQDLKLLPKDMVFEKLTRYQIFIGGYWDLDSPCETKRALKLNDVNRSLHLVDGIGKLLKKTEELSLRELSGTKSVFYELDKEDFLQLKHLHVNGSREIQYIVYSIHPGVQEHVLFPKLESLLLRSLIYLEKVCHGPIPKGSFGNLKTLKVSKCHELKIFLPLTMATGLLHLQNIEIEECIIMRQIIAYERESEIIEDSNAGTTLQLFSKLQSLSLHGLPELMKFISKLGDMSLTRNARLEGNCDIHMSFFNHQISFPNLEKLELYNLPKLKEIWHHQLSHGFFYNLQILRVYNCLGLLNLIPSNLIHSLNHLKDLSVAKCKVLKHVFDLQGLDENISILPKLESLWLWELPNLKCIICNEDKDEVEDEEHVNTLTKDVVLFNGKVLFPNLEKLQLYHLSKLKEIWQHQLPLDSFSNLQILVVKKCPHLRNLIPCHLIKSFKNLIEIQVSNCKVLKHVFDFQGLNRNVEIFPKLKTLKLEGLHRLKSIICNEDNNYSMRCLFSPPMPMNFQNLKHLSIKDCVKEDEEGGHVSTPTQDITLFSEKIAFPSLEDLDISNLDNVEKIWHYEFSADSFGKLKRLSVESCQKLQNVIPSNMVKRLSSLQNLKIVDCNLVEVVFDLEAIDSKESLDIPALQLRELCLDNLKNLKFVWNKAPQGLLTYQNLKSVQVSYCPSLKIPLPGYVVRSLLQVKEVVMNSCGVEEIVAYENVAKVMTMFFFPEVTSRTNSCLKELERFYLGLHALEWPKLKTLEVESCESLEILASKLDQTGEQPIFLCDKVAFPNLEFLNLSLKLKEIQDLHVLFGALSNLKILIVENCPFLLSLFSSQCLNNLKKLTVKKCDLLEEVFDLKGLDHGDDEHVEMLSKLEEVSLIDLPELRYICNNSPPQVSCFQNLKSLQVKHCNSLTYLFSPSMVLGLEQLQDLCIEHCPAMKEILTVEGRDTDNWPRQVSCLQNLKFLQVKQCHSLMYLFPYSVALGLKQLQDLCIEHSKMKEIVTAEEAITDKISFPQITHVSLMKLPKLRNFYLRTQTLEKIHTRDSNITPGVLFNEEIALPRLEDLDISNLDNVEKIWHNEFIADSFGKLKRLSVESCQKLQNVIPSNMVKRLSSLQILKIVTCNSVEEVFDLKAIDSKESHDIPALQLRELCLDHLENLKFVWNKAPQGLLTYQNLNHVQVSYCPSLKVPFPGYVVRSLLQVKEVDKNSCGVEEIVAYEDVAKVVAMFLFPEVTSLTNSCLKELECFYLGLHALEWPKLKTLEVESCESLEILASKLDKTVEQPIFLCEKVTFPNVEYLNLSLKLKEIQDLQDLFGALPNLKTLIVENCPFLLSLFSSQFIQCLNNFEKLTVKKCDLLEEVFDLKGLDHGDDEHVEMLSKLEEVSLIELPKLRYICNNSPPQVLCFQNLKSLQVKQCPSLVYLFSSSIALALVRLQDLHIEQCYTMEEIVTAEEGVTDKIIFPQITHVSLLKLPKLTSFYLSQTLENIRMGDSNTAPGVLFNEEVAFPNLEFLYVSGLDNVKKIWHNQLLANSFSKLKEMKVENCNELQNISTSNVLNWLPSLELLRIAICGKLQEVFDLDVTNVQEDVTDNRLSQLVLDDLQNLEHVCHKVLGKKLCLQNLKFLEVRECGSVKKIFSPYTELEGVREIVRQEEGAEEVIDKIDFPELTSLSLKSLPSLASFYRRVGPGDHDILITVLFNEKVVFPSLESLEISGLGNMKKIWHNKLIENSFSKLKQVKIENCNGLQNVLPSNVLHWLPSLHFLRIASCDQLKEVFDLDGAGDVLENVTATELNHLVLQDLPKLQHIWNKDPYGILTFQNLDFVEVFGCHGLKSHFPAGSLVRDLSQLEKQLIRSRGIEDFGGKDEGKDFVFPKVTYDKLFDLPKNKGKEVLKVHD